MHSLPDWGVSAGSGLAPTLSSANPARGSRETRTPRSRRSQLTPPAPWQGARRSPVRFSGWIWTGPGLVTARRTTRALLLGNAPCSRLLGVTPKQGCAQRTRALQLGWGHAPPP